MDEGESSGNPPLQMYQVPLCVCKVYREVSLCMTLRAYTHGSMSENWSKLVPLCTQNVPNANSHH